MKRFKHITAGLLAAFMLSVSSCDEFLDVNQDPNSPTKAPISQVLTSATVSTAFVNGSDLHRYTSLLMQQLSGQAGNTVQTRFYQQYLIQPSDLNGMYDQYYVTVLPDLQYVIDNSAGSPHYTGVAKILKGFAFSQVVDVWGDVPFSEALKGTENSTPKVDDDAAIYTAIISLLNEGIADVKNPTSVLTPGDDETIYEGDLVKWEKFANSLKLRLFLKYSEVNPAFAKAQMDALIATGGPFMTSNADNFEMDFSTTQGAQNPIHQFEVERLNYLFPNKFLVDLMNSKADPRRQSFFTDFPFNSGQYKGAAAGDEESINFSRLHTYLRGDLNAAITPNAAGAIAANAAYNNAYNGDAPIRMMTFAEYNFIRAEHALRFGGGLATAVPFYEAGIRASMTDAGVTTAAQTAYLLANPLLATNTLRQIIEQKYIANYGVALEPWNDWRRTGFPAISPVPASLAATDYIPRTLYYPEAETLTNPNVKQKPDMKVRVFWDTRP
ncbi:SusD/RagB family nutrient-binding outer membrane lipoprotein [Rufibacter sp. LB8]|uniref:SusD/RagB family nutrient-binding outer membrane lipoprotein n=1 Tax=Rufibacter sp. LB8 TaxID=2777781 RepID=UPI00178C1BAF|nr:SusD/RagB family nutrient-binding outer membrane lipoprotein [Rufibacter sp. LB8]